MPQNGCIRASRPVHGPLAPNRTYRPNADGRGGTHSMCTRQTVAKKEGRVASIRPRLSSAQVIVTDMTTRVGKHPNLAGKQANQTQFVRSRGGKRRVGRLRVAPTENRKRTTAYGKPQISETGNRKRKTEKRKTKNENGKRRSGRRMSTFHLLVQYPTMATGLF